MAEGSQPLFTNWRTGKQTTIVSGIGTASVSNSQLAGPIATVIGTASIANEKLAGPIVSIIGTASVSNSQLAGPIVNIIGTASISNDQIDNTPVVIASGSLSGFSQIDIIDIPVGFSFIVYELTSASYVDINGAAKLQLSTNNGVSFDGATANYSLFSFSGAVSSPSIVVPFSLTTAGDTFDFAANIDGYQSGLYPRSDGHIKIAGVGSNMSWGLYVGSKDAINAVRITVATASFDAGSYRLTGIY